jgi:hypothetical protein
VRLIIHVGPHKTGTSALQAFLDRNHEPLRERGVWYRGEGAGRNHIAMAFAFQSWPDGATVLLHRYIQAASEAGCHTCIVSAEGFARPKLDATPVLAALAATPATFVAYMRHPADRLVSLHDQIVRGNADTRPIEALNFDPTSRRPLGKWAEAPGHAFMLAPFDQSQWPGGSLFGDFLAMLGIPEHGLDMAPDSEHANRSLPPGLTEVLRLANGLSMPDEMRGAFIDRLRALAEAHPEWYHVDLLGAVRRNDIAKAIRDAIDYWRPYFRPGFDPGYLWRP